MNRPPAANSMSGHSASVLTRHDANHRSPAAPPIRVLIADDHAIMRQSLR